MKVFNIEVIQELIEIDEMDQTDLINELISDFGGSAQQQLNNISSAALKNDLAALEMAAHSLKSSANLLGLEILASHAYSIEEAARDGHIKTSSIESLDQSFKDSKSLLSEFQISRKRKAPETN